MLKLLAALSLLLPATHARNTTRNPIFHGFNPWISKIVFGMSGCSMTAINRIRPHNDLYQSFQA